MKKPKSLQSLGLFGGLFYVCLLSSQGCAHKPASQNANSEVTPPAAEAAEAKNAGTIPVAAELPNPLTLKLVGEKGREEVSVNCSTTTTSLFVGQEIRHKTIQAVDFKVRTKTTDVEPNGNFKQVLETTDKDGEGDLHDYAYPEEGEKLEMEYSPEGAVLKAGKYPKDSIFFVPPLPMPTKPVKPGDSWDTSNSWKSSVDGIPMIAQMHATYVGSKQCGVHLCANIEVKGVVEAEAKVQKSKKKKKGAESAKTYNKYSHALSGRFLFEPTRGLLVWSDFSTDEQMQGKAARVVLQSLLRSELVEPPGYRTKDRGEPSCPYETKAE